MKMQIDTGDSEPVSQRPYPFTMKHYNRVKNGTNRLLDAEVICSSCSSWSGHIIVVPKGDSGKCLVIDYRVLNKVTWKYVWPMQKVEDIFSKLNGTNTFQPLTFMLGVITYPLMKTLSPKQLLHLLLENMSNWRFLLDWHRHQHASKNSWMKYWRTCLLLLPT